MKWRQIQKKNYDDDGHDDDNDDDHDDFLIISEISKSFLALIKLLPFRDLDLESSWVCN